MLRFSGTHALDQDKFLARRTCHPNLGSRCRRCKFLHSKVPPNSPDRFQISSATQAIDRRVVGFITLNANNPDDGAFQMQSNGCLNEIDNAVRVASVHVEQPP